MPWTAYIDGGARGNPGPAGVGVEIRNSDGDVVFSGGFFLGRQTNNAAEYAGLLAALDLLARAKADPIEIVSDSQLMVRQINGEYRVKAPQLKVFYMEARRRLEGFNGWAMRHVYREENTAADGRANEAMDMGEDVIATDTLKLTSEKRPSVEPDGLF